jgi:hypothetical protein
MKVSFINILALTIFIFYFIFLISFNIIGPDYISYTAASELSVTQNFFKLKEFLSWSIIDTFAQIQSAIDFLGLKFFSSLIFSLIFLYSYELIKDEFLYTKIKIKTLPLFRLLLIALTFFVAASPYVNLLALSALRQGISLIFLIFVIINISSGFKKSLIWFLFAIFSHNSALIFLPLFVFLIFKNNFLRFSLIFLAASCFFIISFFIPFQPSVDSDNRIIYGTFSLLSIIFFITKRNNFSECDLLLISGVLLVLPFFNLVSYFDRLGLYAAFFSSILIAKKIISTGPRSFSLASTLLLLILTLSVTTLITYPPLIN